MSVLTKNKQDLHDAAIAEYTHAETEKNTAIIEYVAMMCEVDIPTEEGSENVAEV